MAGFAHITRVDMPVGQRVTARTGTGAVNLRVIDGDHRRPTRGTVARHTHIGGIDMPIRQTVAACTGTSAIDFYMINSGYRRPAGSAMARFTN